MTWRWHSLNLSAVVLTAACGGSQPANNRPAQPPSAAAAALVTPTKPAGAITVLAAKAAGAEMAVVTGRIANIVPGFAVFTLMDSSLPYCGEKNSEDKCKTPWDYCCEGAEKRTQHSLLVEARGADGRPLATPSLPDLRLLDRVTVTGRLTKDEFGNHVLLATSWYREERPDLPSDLRWPQ